MSEWRRSAAFLISKELSLYIRLYDREGKNGCKTGLLACPSYLPRAFAARRQARGPVPHTGLEVQAGYEFQASGARIVGVVEVAEGSAGLPERAPDSAVDAAACGTAAVDHNVRMVEDVQRLDAEL